MKTLCDDMDVQEAMHFWYMECVERACQEPTGSFLYTFWWSLRCELSRDDMIEKWARDPDEAFKSWLRYLEFKWDQLADHREGRA